MVLELADRAEAALGEEWQVLSADAGAWTWVRQPSAARS
jgi:hypothetical protein